MKEYKPSIYVICKNSVYGLLGGIIVGFIANMFFHYLLACLVGVGACALIIYFAVYKDSISIMLDDVKITFFRFGRLIYEFPLEDTHFQVKMKITTEDAISDNDCDLIVTTHDGHTETIDCSMLGPETFSRLLKDLGLADKIESLNKK